MTRAIASPMATSAVTVVTVKKVVFVKAFQNTAPLDPNTASR